MSAINMRRFLNIVCEAGTKTTTKTGNPTFANAASKGEVSAPHKAAQAATKFGRTVGANPDLMRRAARKIDPSAAEVMRRARENLPPMDDAGYIVPEPPEHTTLPAVTTGLPTQAAALNWHPLPSLPGYRMWIGYFHDLFNNVFGMNEKQIQVATTLTSNDHDVKNLIAYVVKHGEKDDDFDLEMFGLPREIFHISQGYVYYIDSEVYLILEEKLGDSTNYYVYASPKQRERTAKLGSGLRGIAHG